MVREVITVAALTAAFSFLGGCTPRRQTLPGFRSETKEFSQSGETFGNPLMGYAPVPEGEKYQRTSHFCM